jgi:putative transposase
MVTFIDEHRAAYGVEPICAVLPIAPSTYYSHKARQADPERRCPRERRDDVLRARIRQVWGGTLQSTVCARCGGSCGAAASRWPAVR